MIQASFGPRRAEEADALRTRLLLCGSAMSFMGGLLSGTAPLRGRAGLEMVVPRPWTSGRPPGSGRSMTLRLAVQLYSIVGGTPAYRDGVGGRPSTEGSVADLGEWVGRQRAEQVQPAVSGGSVPAGGRARHT